MTDQKLSERKMPSCFGVEVVIDRGYYCKHHPNCLLLDDCYKNLISNLPEIKALEAEVKTLTTELTNVRREAVFAISKAQTERSQQIYDEAELSGYSRGVADSEERLAKAEAKVKRLAEELDKKSKPTRQEIMNRRFPI